jgi:polysaccharide export outer membrane protein
MISKPVHLVVPIAAVALAIVAAAPPVAFAQSPPVARATPPASVPSLPPTPPAAAAPIASDYRLAPGDKLRVEVYKDPQLSQSLQIRPDGKITLPLIGDLTATSLTPLQLRDQITNSLKEYITNPVVTVIVVEANPATVFVMGEVAQPGAVPVKGKMTVLQALAMAGGFKEFADVKGIRVLRQSKDGTKVDTISFNYNEAIKGRSAPMLLIPGDMVIVP